MTNAHPGSIHASPMYIPKYQLYKLYEGNNLVSLQLFHSWEVQILYTWQYLIPLKQIALYGSKIHKTASRLSRPWM